MARPVGDVVGKSASTGPPSRSHLTTFCSLPRPADRWISGGSGAGEFAAGSPASGGGGEGGSGVSGDEDDGGGNEGGGNGDSGGGGGEGEGGCGEGEGGGSGLGDGGDGEGGEDGWTEEAKHIGSHCGGMALRSDARVVGLKCEPGLLMPMPMPPCGIQSRRVKREGNAAWLHRGTWVCRM